MMAALLRCMIQSLNGVVPGRMTTMNIPNRPT